MRSERTCEQIKETPEKSDRQIAGNLGVSPTTVGAMRKQLGEPGDVSRLDTSVNTLGREQPQQRKAPEAKPATPESVDGPEAYSLDNDFINEPVIAA